MEQSGVAAFVLAGGASSRMGRDKALVPFAGRPLIVHALATLRAADVEPAIAGSCSALGDFAPVVRDLAPARGPLAGICAALASTTADWCIFLPVDVPLLPASLLRYLLSHAQLMGACVTLASVSGFVQTFPAVIHRAILPLLRAELDAGRSGCFAAFRAAAAGSRLAVVPVELLVQCGHIAHPDALPAVHWFLNVNTPGDLCRAEALAARHRIA